MAGAFRCDLEKYYRIQYGDRQPGWFRKLRFCLASFGLHCVATYRFGKWTERLSRKFWPAAVPFRIMHWYLNFCMEFFHHVCLCDAEIGPGLFIGHVGTIYIGPVKVGSNFSVGHNVSIGVGHSDGKEGVPIIGDDVWVGQMCVISGAISIGNRVTVASGCIVSRSVPDGCLVAGNPGRVVLNDYDNSGLFALPARADSAAS